MKQMNSAMQVPKSERYRLYNFQNVLSTADGANKWHNNALLEFPAPEVPIGVRYVLIDRVVHDCFLGHTLVIVQFCRNEYK